MAAAASISAPRPCALALRPQGRVAGTGVVVPLQVTGPIRSPAVKVNAVGTFEENAVTVAGGIIGTATPLGLLSGLVGGNKLPGGADGSIVPRRAGGGARRGGARRVRPAAKCRRPTAEEEKSGRRPAPTVIPINPRSF